MSRRNQAIVSCCVLICICAHLVSAKLDSKCATDIDCGNTTEICNQGKCACKNGVTINGTTVCLVQNLQSQSCHPVCTDPRKYCNSSTGQCTCKPKYKPITNDRCQADVKVYDSCEVWDDVLIDNACCYKKKVVCNEGYTPAQATPPMPTQCYPGTISIGSYCDSADVLTLKSMHAHCSQNVAVCDEGYSTGDEATKCVIDKGSDIGDSCSADFQCTENTKNSFCSPDKKCICDVGYTKFTRKSKVLCAYGAELQSYCDGTDYLCKDSYASCKNNVCVCTNTIYYRGVYYCLYGLPFGGLIAIMVGGFLIFVIFCAVLGWILKKKCGATSSEDSVRLT